MSENTPRRVFSDIINLIEKVKRKMGGFHFILR